MYNETGVTEMFLGQVRHYNDGLTQEQRNSRQMTILPDIVAFLAEERLQNPPAQPSTPHRTADGMQYGWRLVAERKKAGANSYGLFTSLLEDGRLVQSDPVYQAVDPLELLYREVTSPGSGGYQLQVIEGFYELVDRLVFDLPKTLGIPRFDFCHEFPQFMTPSIEEEGRKQTALNRLIDSVFDEVEHAYRAGYRGCRIHYRGRLVAPAALAQQLATELRVSPFRRHGRDSTGIFVEFAEDYTKRAYKVVGSRPGILGWLVDALSGR